EELHIAGYQGNSDMIPLDFSSFPNLKELCLYPTIWDVVSLIEEFLEFHRNLKTVRSLTLCIRQNYQPQQPTRWWADCLPKPHINATYLTKEDRAFLKRRLWFMGLFQRCYAIKFAQGSARVLFIS